MRLEGERLTLIMDLMNHYRRKQSTVICVLLVRQPLKDAYSSHRLHVRQLPSISLSKFSTSHGSSPSNNRFHSNNLFIHPSGATSPASNAQPQRRIIPKSNKYSFDAFHTRPRPITIVKQGNEKPRKTISILLNRRTFQTYDQLLADISDAFGQHKSRQAKVSRRRPAVFPVDETKKRISFLSAEKRNSRCVRVTGE